MCDSAIRKKGLSALHVSQQCWPYCAKNSFIVAIDVIRIFCKGRSLTNRFLVFCQSIYSVSGLSFDTESNIRRLLLLGSPVICVFICFSWTALSTISTGGV